LRVVKLALLSFLVLFALITAFSLMIPSQVRVSRAVNLSGRPAAVMGFVKDEGRWPQWHPAFLPDTPARQKPVLQLQQASDSELVYTMPGPGGLPATNGWKIYTHPGADSITLQWYVDLRTRWYPWQKFGSLFYESTYGVMMEQGLANLKTRINGGQVP
jgi:hypothetical protein